MLFRDRSTKDGNYQLPSMKYTPPPNLCPLPGIKNQKSEKLKNREKAKKGQTENNTINLNLKGLGIQSPPFIIQSHNKLMSIGLASFGSDVDQLSNNQSFDVAQARS